MSEVAAAAAAGPAPSSVQIEPDDQRIIDQIDEKIPLREKRARQFQRAAIAFGIATALSSIISALLIAFGVAEDSRWVAVLAAIPAVIATANNTLKVNSRGTAHRTASFALILLASKARKGEIKGTALKDEYFEIEKVVKTGIPWGSS